jgi:hypothetical protein
LSPKSEKNHYIGESIFIHEILVMLKKNTYCGRSYSWNILLFKYCDFKKNEDQDITYNTNLIQQQILNVGKLVVTEGHFSEVITYKKSAKILDGYAFF